MTQSNVAAASGPTPLTPSEAEQEARDQDDSAARIARMCDLLRRYPRIDEAQRQELLHFLKKGRHIEIGTVSAREGMPARMNSFRHDHRSEFRLKPLQVMGFVLLMVGPIALLALAVIG